MLRRMMMIGIFLLSVMAVGCSSSEDDGSSQPDTTPDVSSFDAMVDGGLVDMQVAADVGVLPDVHVDMGPSIPAVPDYTNTDHWLCHPNKNDGPCHENLDVTQVNPDGSLDVIPFQAAANPAVDCFYVYPTCSMDPAPNADMVAGDEETFITKVQAARLQGHCRVFAPVYRQVTIGGLVSGNPDVDRVMAYQDVADAFSHYMENHNDGRGVIIIGHSQGTAILRQIMMERVDPSPELRQQLVGAYLLGFSVEVPRGEDIGGTFNHIPLCNEVGQTGCVVSYATYRATNTPTEGALFGLAEGDMAEAACRHPAALGGGSAPLNGVYPVGSFGSFDSFVTGNRSAFADPEMQSQIMTPFFSAPGLAQGECVTRGAYSYLEVSVNADPEDPRADDVGGDLILPGWGLHLVDINIALLDIEAAIARQIEMYLAE